MSLAESKHHSHALATTILLITLTSLSCATEAPLPSPSLAAKRAEPCDIDSAGGLCFHVIGHRGAAGYAPENTLASVRRAVELGAIEVEIDVQLSRDGELILYHDATLDKKTNLTGAVRDHDAAALLQTEIGSWFDRTHPDATPRYAGTRLATLEHLFEDFADRLYYHVELKSSESVLPQRVVELLANRNLTHRATITSFDFAQLDRARQAAPQSPLCWLLRSQLPPDSRGGQALLEEQRAQIDRAEAAGFSMVGVRASRLSPEVVAYARERHRSIRAFGIKSDADMNHAISLGVDGMTTDWPDKLIRRLNSSKPSD